MYKIFTPSSDYRLRWIASISAKLSIFLFLIETMLILFQLYVSNWFDFSVTTAKWYDLSFSFILKTQQDLGVCPITQCSFRFEKFYFTFYGVRNHNNNASFLLLKFEWSSNDTFLPIHWRLNPFILIFYDFQRNPKHSTLLINNLFRMRKLKIVLYLFLFIPSSHTLNIKHHDFGHHIENVKRKDLTMRIR